jgi:hypothetical protein
MDDVQKLASALKEQDGIVRAGEVRDFLGTGKIGRLMKTLGFRQVSRGQGSRLYARGTSRRVLRLVSEI